MRRNKAENITDLLQRFLRSEGLETPLNEVRIVNAWPEVVGHVIMRYTGNCFVKNQKLYVQLTSPALRSDLMLARENLVKRLNDAVGAQVIVDIVFTS